MLVYLPGPISAYIYASIFLPSQIVSRPLNYSAIELCRIGVFSNKPLFCMDYGLFFLGYNYMTVVWQGNLTTTISINRFQEAIASGKKLFMYLYDLHLIA